MFAVRDIIIFAVLAGLLAAGALAALPWSRRPSRFRLGVVAMILDLLDKEGGTDNEVGDTRATEG